MIAWEQCSGPVHWRSKDRRYTVAEHQTHDGLRFRAIRSGNMKVDWTSELRMSALDARADAEAHALVATVPDYGQGVSAPTVAS